MVISLVVIFGLPGPSATVQLSLKGDSTLILASLPPQLSFLGPSSPPTLPCGYENPTRNKPAQKKRTFPHSPSLLASSTKLANSMSASVPAAAFDVLLTNSCADSLIPTCAITVQNWTHGDGERHQRREEPASDCLSWQRASFRHPAVFVCPELAASRSAHVHSILPTLHPN